MEGLRKTKGADDRETLEATADVGNLYIQLDQPEEGAALIARAWEGFRRTLGDRDVSTLRMTVLAMIQLGRKKPAEAERMAKDVVEKLQTEVGADSPHTHAARRDLASIYDASGRHEKARWLLKDVLKEQRRILGDKHPDTLYTIATLAEHYVHSGNFDEVERYAVEALEGARTILNDKHQVRAAALGFLSTVYGTRADLKKLEPVLIESLELSRYRWGPDAEVTVRGDSTVCLLLLYLGRYAEAEPYCREALAFRSKNSPESQERFWLELRLGISALGQGKYDEARPHMLIAYNGMKPREKGRLPADMSDLGWLIEQILRLRNESGKLLHDAALAKLRSDPTLQSIVFDLQFPIRPFAPP